MNLDFALVNRALMNIGKNPLTQTDRETDNEAWQTARDFFLHTMLEALAQVEWTGAKRRRELAPARMNYKRNREFAHAYALPMDCAKPVELDGQEYYKVEASVLFTDAAPARLLYVSSGKRFIGFWKRERVNGKWVVKMEAASGGGASRRLTPEYISGGDGRRGRRLEWGDGFISGGGGSRKVTPPPEAFEDYPDYRALPLEPNFYLYWECLLSGKYALRMTDQPGLADAWLAKAMAYGRAAEVVSIAGSAGRKKAPGTWQEDLGLN